MTRLPHSLISNLIRFQAFFANGKAIFDIPDHLAVCAIVYSVVWAYIFIANLIRFQAFFADGKVTFNILKHLALYSYILLYTV